MAVKDIRWPQSKPPIMVDGRPYRQIKGKLLPVKPPTREFLLDLVGKANGLEREISGEIQYTVKSVSDHLLWVVDEVTGKAYQLTATELPPGYVKE